MEIVQFEDRDARDKKAPCRESSSLLKTPSERKHGEGGAKRNTYWGSVGVGEEENIPYVTLVGCGRRRNIFWGELCFHMHQNDRGNVMEKMSKK